MVMTSGSRLILVLFAALIVPLGGSSQELPNNGTVITVDALGDSHDTTPGDGRCSDAAANCTLRAAVEEANGTPEMDVVIFDVPMSAVIDLTLGEIRVTRPLGIHGRGARLLTIQRSAAPSTPAFRIFNIAPTGSLTLRRLTIKNGSSTAGGGIYAESYVFLFDIALIGNRAQAGGAIYFASFANPEPGINEINRCLIMSNAAELLGGAIYLGKFRQATLKVSTITSNTADSGGALYNNGGWFRVVNNTLTANTAPQASSVNNATGTIEVVNNIIGPDQGQSSVSGYFASHGNNIVTNSTGSTGWRAQDKTGVDPMLAPLADNGGETDSFALLGGSPALEAANDCVMRFGPSGCDSLFFLMYDQRRRNRWSAPRIDIGSIEAGAPLADRPEVARPTIDHRYASIVGARVIVTNTKTLERRYTFIGAGRMTAPVPIQFTDEYIFELAKRRPYLNNFTCINIDARC